MGADPPVIFHAFTGFGVGGAQVRFCALANHFGRAFRHVVFAMDGRHDCLSRLDPAVDVTVARTVARKRATLGNRARFRACLRASRADLLVTYNWGSIEWAMANRPQLLPHIHIEDGFGPDEAQGQLRRRVLTRRLVLSRSTVVVPSRTLERLALDVWKLDPRHVRYVPNGIDCARFSAPGIAPFPWPGDTPVVGTVAALRPEKNLRRLLEAFRLVRARIPCRLLIAGDGTERVGLEALAAEMGLGADAMFAGYVAETERVYAALRVFALSSDTEQMPTAVIEAMAAGLPVAATPVGDVAHMLAPENRPLLAGMNAESLARSIATLLENPALGASIGAANRAAAEAGFGQDKMFALYRGLFSPGAEAA